MLRGQGRTVLLIGVLSVAAHVTAGAQGRPYTAIEVNTVGRAVVDAQIARYGRVRNANWDQKLHQFSRSLAPRAASVARPVRRSG
jgi:hypothetical protein